MRRAILLGLGLAVASACGSPSQPQPTLPPPPPAPPTATPLAAPSPSPALPAPLAVPAVRPAASPSPAVVPLSVVVGYTGSDLRTSLDLLVQEHLSLAAAALDAAAANREDELGAISSSLDQSSTALAQVVGSVNGADAQQQFAEAWRRRIGSLVDYARAAGAQDVALRAAARADVEARDGAIADLLASSSLAPDTARAQITRQTQALTAAADAFAGHDTRAALTTLRGVTAAVDELGRPLAAAVEPRAVQQVPGPTEGADIDLRTRLDRLLEEHVYLRAWAVGAAAGGRTADADAASAVGDTAAGDLGQEVADVFGADPGGRFADLWRQQGADLMTYTRATDAPARQQAQADLDRVRGDLDALLSGTNTLLPKGMVGEMLRPSFQALGAAADAFAARDFVAAYNRAHDAARQVQRFGDQLAQTTVDRFPRRYLALGTPGPAPSGGGAAAGGAPGGGVTTGGGATSSVGAASAGGGVSTGGGATSSVGAAAGVGGVSTGGGATSSVGATTGGGGVSTGSAASSVGATTGGAGTTGSGTSSVGATTGIGGVSTGGGATSSVGATTGGGAGTGGGATTGTSSAGTAPGGAPGAPAVSSSSSTGAAPSGPSAPTPSSGGVSTAPTLATGGGSSATTGGAAPAQPVPAPTLIPIPTLAVSVPTRTP